MSENSSILFHDFRFLTPPMKKWLLLVEDDPDQAALMQVVVEQADFGVLTVGNAKDALSCMQQASVDIVLSDYNLPDMTGVDLYKVASERGLFPAFVIMTAVTDMRLAYEALSAGLDDFVVKDTSGSFLEVLNSILQRAIEKHALRGRARALRRELEEAKDLSHATLDIVEQGVLMLGSDHAVKYRNRRFNKLFAKSKSALDNLSDLVSLAILLSENGVLGGAETISHLRDLLRKRVIDQNETVDYRTQDGSIYELKCRSLKDGVHVIIFDEVTHQRAEVDVLAKTIQWAPVAMLAVDTDGKIILANQAAHHLTGYDQTELLGQSVEILIPPSVRKGHKSHMANFFDNMTTRLMREGRDLSLMRKDLTPLPVEISLSGIQLRGETRVLATINDLSPRIQAENAIRQASALTQSIIDSSPFSMVAMDPEGTILAVSPALESLVHYDKHFLVGSRSLPLLFDSDELNEHALALTLELGREVRPGQEVLIAKAREGATDRNNWTFVCRDGTRIPVNVTVSPLRTSEAQLTGFLLVAYDRSDQKRHEEYMRHIAHHDPLTQLPNRMLMLDRLNMALQRLRRYGGSLGVAVLDVDKFKQINDTYGHDAGDELLVEVAHRLVKAVRESDTVARMGGDEFMMILPDIGAQENADNLCKKIHAAFSEPVRIGDQVLKVTPSFGLSLSPRDGMDHEALIKRADVAMYEAKRAGRNGYRIYNERMATLQSDERMFEQALRNALENQLLNVHYQPMIDLNGKTVTGFEAFLRWNDDQFGTVSPGRMIPMAESSGFILKLGEWVLTRACSDVAELMARSGQTFTVSVNLSAKQFEHADLLETIRRALRLSGLNPTHLVLEVNEAMLRSEPGNLSERLTQLKALGIRLAVDDFGTGFSNLAQIAELGVSLIKVDRACLGDLTRRDQALFRALKTFTEGAGLDLVAEGVENLEQITFLNTLGCNLVQGYYFARPQPLSDVIESLDKVMELAKQLGREK